MDRTDLIFTYQERLYRLALLVAGEPRAAARLVERAFARLPRRSADPESALLAALRRPARPLVWGGLHMPFRPYALPLTPSGAAAADLAALRDLLAAAPPALRHELGLRYLLGLEGVGRQGDTGTRGHGESAESMLYGRTRGSAPNARAAAATPAPEARAESMSSALRPTTLPAFLALLARARGRLPAEADLGAVPAYARLRLGLADDAEAQALRAAALTDDAAGRLARAIRDGLLATDEWLRAVLPALFAAPVPPELSRRMLRRAAPRRPLLRWGRPLALQLGLIGLVAALLAALLLWPGRAPEQAGRPPGLAMAEAPGLAPSALLARALDRFESDATAGGVLHERYLAAVGARRWELERWYDRGSPQRLRIEVRDDEGNLLYGLATDGATTIQLRSGGSLEPNSGRRAIYGIDHPADPAQIARLMPLMRGQPDGLMIFNEGEYYAIDRYYLALAHAATPRDLGAATVAGRPARLIGFRSDRPFPPERGAPPEAWPAQPSQIVLAVDAERYALLEARVIPESAGAPSEVQFPWRAAAFEALTGTASATFALPPVEQMQHPEFALVSPRLIEAPAELLLRLPELLQASATIYVPPQPGEPSVGYAMAMDNDPLLIRETEHTVMLLMRFATANFEGATRRRREAGGLTYDLIDMPGSQALFPASMAMIYLSPDEQTGLYLLYAHSYATPAERESLLGDLIRSLRPLTPENMQELAGDFGG